MGKVSDALEKSNKERIRQVPPRRVATKPVRRDTPQVTTRKVSQIRIPTKGKTRLDKNLIAALNARAFEAEQFKLLKTNLLFPASGKPPKVIMVTSAVPSEGKSFVAANLSISIAQNIDDHVLLMDGDLRLPTISKLFGIEKAQGLAEVLMGKTTMESVLHKVAVDKLTVLPAGKPPSNPSELLSSEKMSAIISETKNRYSDRYIIIDTAPPRITAESSAIARHVDGILIVVHAGKTKRETVEELVKSLGKEKILGVVLNRLDVHRFAYYGYAKYGKYSKYYKQS